MNLFPNKKYKWIVKTWKKHYITLTFKSQAQAIFIHPAQEPPPDSAADKELHILLSIDVWAGALTRFCSNFVGVLARRSLKQT
jgi:hypothetical protein